MGKPDKGALYGSILIIIMNCVQSYLEALPILYYTSVSLGAVIIIYNLLLVARGVTRLFESRLRLSERYGKSSWALVTGSSEGIGKEFALQLAREGFNIILLARRRHKLEDVKAEIERQVPSAELKIIVADLVEEGKKDTIAEVLSEINPLKKGISIVVNNAGVDALAPFTDLQVEKIIDMVSINCFALSAICHKFIPIFSERLLKEGKRSAIINVGSVAGQMPLPLHNIYSASKGYVGRLTKNLSKAHSDIDWLLLKPSEVSTAMTCFKKQDLLTVSARKCVSGALKDLGRRVETNGYITHKIQSYIYSCLPEGIFNFFWTRFFAPEFMAERQRYQQRGS